MLAVIKLGKRRPPLSSTITASQNGFDRSEKVLRRLTLFAGVGARLLHAAKGA